MSPRLREKKRLRELRLLGIKPGIPTYIPPELIARGFKLKFYDTSDVKIGEIGSDVKTGKISTVNFELMGLGCAAFSFVIDEMPKIFKYEIDLEDESLVGYWPFDKGTGMVAYDKSKYGNDGNLENMVEGDWVIGKIGKALDFDGEDNYVLIAHDINLNVNHVTMSVWFNPDAQNINDFIISKYISEDDASFGMGITDEAGKKLKVLIRAGGTTDILTVPYTFTLGQWYHMIVTYDGTDIITYIDGIPVDSRAHSVGGNMDTTTADLEIGGLLGAALVFDGLIDEVLIYKRALTATEIKALYELKVGKYIDAFDMAYRTRVDIHPYFDESPWFTGFIQTIPQTGQKKPFEYTGFGFFDQLDWVTITQSYESQELADIVKDIIQNTVAPDTQIIYNAAKIEATGYTVQSIDFDHTFAKDAIQTLADMAQDYEFGVDDSREFYFRPITTSVQYSYWVGKHFQNVTIEENPFTVRNKLYIKMGEIQAGGSNIIGSVQDNPSIATHGLREEIITAPESLNSTDATRWANMILSEKSIPAVKAKIANILFDETKAKIIAKGKARITVYDGTEYSLFIKAISYSITAGGILGSMDLE